MNFYAFHINDFRGATWHLSNLARYVYRLLIDMYYDTEAALSKDLDVLAHKCSLKVDFNDPLQAAKAFIEAETARRDAERKLQIAGGALTRLGAAKGSQCLRESAKLLKWQQTPFIDWLLVKKMLFRDAGKQLCVYQEYLGRGWFEYRADEKNGHAFKQVMVTPLGLQKLAQKLEVVA